MKYQVSGDTAFGLIIRKAHVEEEVTVTTAMEKLHLMEPKSTKSSSTTTVDQPTYHSSTVAWAGTNRMIEAAPDDDFAGLERSLNKKSANEEVKKLVFVRRRAANRTEENLMEVEVPEEVRYGYRRR